MIKLVKFLSIFLIALSFGFYTYVAAESKTNLNWDEVVKHAQEEEKQGKILWEKFSNKEINCSDLKDEDFAALGEYFMGKMTGEGHAAMNLMMMQMHGEEGEEVMHIVMGKRFSGCDNNVNYPFMMPMMGGMMMPISDYAGSWSAPLNNSSNSMMNMMNFGWQGFGFWGILGWIVMILWWVLIVVALVALVRWLWDKIGNKENKKKNNFQALEILAERYVKGEISKEEFEEKKKELEKLIK